MKYIPYNLHNRFRHLYFAINLFVLAVIMVSLSTTSVLAGSATWNSNPTNNQWYNANNWTPSTVPDSATDIATFGTTTQPAITIVDGSDHQTLLNGITFNADASVYIFTVPSGYNHLTLQDVGIVNHSGRMQNFVIDGGGTINGLTFQDATAGSNVTYNIMGGTVLAFNGTSTAGDATFICDNIGSDFFTDSASAGNATFTRNGTAPLTFYGGSSAASGTFTLNAPGTAGTGPASIDFVGGSAANATFTINGTGSGNSNEVFIGPFSAGAVAAHFTANGAIDSNHFPGLVVLEANPGRSILIANAGSGGGSGGLLTWDTTGGNGARVEVFGNGTGDATNGTLDISSTGHGVNVPIGSLEGTGLVELADDKLTVGSNNLSTIFGGIIQDAGGGTNGSGSLTKTGTGTFTLASANTYTGSTTVSAGTLLVTNRNGSATGTGHVTVNGGVVGGTGKISGAVTIGSTTRFGTIAPGLVGRAGKLTTLSAITFNLFGIYNADIDSVRTAADQVVATGVTIGSGATINLSDLGNAVLTSGTVFTIINNKAAVPISGRFSNLADGSTMTVGSNTYRVSYEGGTGNDLTLTVQ